MSASELGRMGVYRIVAPSGNCYVGSTIDFAARRRGHLHDLRKGRHHAHALQAAWAKYGDELRFELLVCALRRADLIVLEQSLIDDLRPEYNSTSVAAAPMRDPVTAARVTASIRNSAAHRIAREQNAKIAHAKISRPVVRLDDGAVFASGYEAARNVGMASADNIGTAIKNGWRFGGYHWKYANEPGAIKDVLAAKIRNRPVVCLANGDIYANAKEACSVWGGSRSGIQRAILTGGNTAGVRWDYAYYPSP